MYVARSQIRSMSKRFISGTLILVVCLCLWGLPAGAAENPQAVIQTGMEQVLKVIQQYPQDNRAQREQLRAVIDGYFDFDALSRLAVGLRLNTLPPEKQQKFTHEFSKLIFNTFLGDVEKYAAEKTTYKQRSIYQGYVVVEALVGGQTIDYYLHLKNEKWMVYDVGVGGMSLVTNYRNQFDPILANGSFDRLSAILKQKIDQVCALGRC